MWNRRKDNEDPAPRPSSPYQRQTPVPPPSSEYAKEGIPMSTTPSRAYEPEMYRGSAVIGKSVVVKGQIFTREDLLIDGEVEGGTIESQEHKLTIGPNGRVHANIKAREIVVLGMVNGNVEASDKIDIRKDARLTGDIKTARIVIEDGAYFKGSIDIMKAEAKPAAPPLRTPPPSAESGTPPLAPGSPK